MQSGKKIETTLTTFTCRKLKYFSKEFYKEKLLDLNWMELFNSNESNVTWDILIRNIRKILDTYNPEEHTRTYQRKRKGYLMRYLSK